DARPVEQADGTRSSHERAQAFVARLALNRAASAEVLSPEPPDRRERQVRPSGGRFAPDSFFAHSLAASASRAISTNCCRPTAPLSPSVRCRTATFPSATSFSPTTSMYGTFASVASRIL